MDKPSTRPRLLFLCQLNPWHRNNGGVIRNYWLICSLAQRFEVDLVTADDSDGSVPADFAAKCSDIQRFPRPAGARAKLLRGLGALRWRSSYYTSGSVTGAMKTGVARLLAANRYAAVYSELGLITALPRDCATPIVYSSHNCESALLTRRAKLEPMWSRLAMTLDAARVRRLETALVSRSVLITPCSQNDIDDLAAFAPSVVTKAVVIPNGVDCAQYAEVACANGTPGVLLITGSFDWLPNRRGLFWFLREVLPLLQNSLAKQGFSVRIVGRMTATFMQKLNAMPDVTAIGNVPRMETELKEASVVVVPVIASSGTRLRILEAWAAGRPILTTTHGAFGLDCINGDDLLVADSPSAFAALATVLLNDPAMRSSLRTAGLARAASYDWSVIGTKLVAAFEQCGLLPASEKETCVAP